MNNKILIEVIVPQTDQKFDVYIPANLKIGKIHNILNKTIEDITNGIYNKKDNNLYDKNGDLLDNNKFVYELDLKNGSSIIIL